MGNKFWKIFGVPKNGSNLSSAKNQPALGPIARSSANILYPISIYYLFCIYKLNFHWCLISDARGDLRGSYFQNHFRMGNKTSQNAAAPNNGTTLSSGLDQTPGDRPGPFLPEASPAISDAKTNNSSRNTKEKVAKEVEPIEAPLLSARPSDNNDDVDTEWVIYYFHHGTNLNLNVKRELLFSEESVDETSDSTSGTSRRRKKKSSRKQ